LHLHIRQLKNPRLGGDFYLLAIFFFFCFYNPGQYYYAYKKPGAPANSIGSINIYPLPENQGGQTLFSLVSFCGASHEAYV